MAENDTPQAPPAPAQDETSQLAAFVQRHKAAQQDSSLITTAIDQVVEAAAKKRMEEIAVIVGKAHNLFVDLKKRRNGIRPKPVGFDLEWKPIMQYSLADEKAKKTLDPVIAKGDQVFSAFLTTQPINSEPLEKWLKEGENALKGAGEAPKTDD